MRMVSAALLLAAALPAVAAPGDELPPRAPLVDYAMVFQFSRSEAGHSEGGRRGIAISGTRVRDELLDGAGMDRKVYIGDKATGQVTEFDPADPARKARRGPMGDVLLPMADGYGRVVQLAGPPRTLGTDTVAGRQCTVLRWQLGEDRQDWCVDAQGIVLRAERKAGLIETRLEALTVRVGPQSDALFQVPDGFSVEDADP
ncbi:MAG: hypothetical protein AB7R90_04425 [Reyranellaceae bacterium]